MKIVIAFACMIGSTVLANILLKMGADSINDQAQILDKIFSWKIIFGLLFFGLSALIYIVILRLLPLNVAQSFAAVQFICVILASYFFLNEPISSTRVIGMLLITIGIFVVSLTR